MEKNVKSIFSKATKPETKAVEELPVVETIQEPVVVPEPEKIIEAPKPLSVSEEKRLRRTGGL